MKRFLSRLLSLALALTLIAGVLILPGCGSADGDPTKDGTQTVTDLLGREVTVPTDIRRVACIGAGALRLYSYVGDLSKLCGVEACEYGFLISVRPYQMVNQTLFQSLPSVGGGGPQGSPDAEALLSVHPDVIFSLYTSDVAAMDDLQKATGIPVVVLSYGATEAFDEDILTSLTLMGRILGREERAGAVTAYIRELKNDLDRRTADVPDADRKTVYLGCQSNYGTHGMGSSTGNYSLFNAVHARNVLDIAGYTGYQKALDLETILSLDPEVIILDAGGLSILKEEYAANRTVFDSLTAFRTGEVYLQMPYNAYYTNLEIAFADAYFIGKVLYPEAFADIDMAEKFGEISEFLLGSDCYSAVAEVMYGGYQRLDVGMLS